MQPNAYPHEYDTPLRATVVDDDFPSTVILSPHERLVLAIEPLLGLVAIDDDGSTRVKLALASAKEELL